MNNWFDPQQLSEVMRGLEQEIESTELPEIEKSTQCRELNEK